jgi:two-component system phosphate regulon response regulator OmpR
MAGERILVVDDDPDIRAVLVEYLGSHGYAASAVEDGARMRESLAQSLPDVVLLDVTLRGEDGLSLARFLREHYRVGIIMVTAAGDVIDRVLGLEMGADDYLAKPFDLRELRARLKSVLRRLASADAPPAATGGEAASAPRPGSRAVIGKCRLDLRSQQLFDDAGHEVAITAMEFALLRAFVEHPNEVLTRDRLLTLTRNREWEPFDRSIDIRIARVRRKVEDDPENPRAIRTVRGAGYMFVPPAEG